MGSGIGKYCKRCGEQLNYDDGFTSNEKFCNKCESIIKYDLKSPLEKIKDLESYD